MAKEEDVIYKIKELDLDMINPTTKRFTNNDSSGTKTIVIGKPGCFAKGTKVLMYNGTIKNVENITPGEQVMGDDSTPRNVLELCNNFDTMYKIIPTKGEPIIVNENHILTLKYKNDNKNIKIIDIVLKDFLNKSINFQKQCKWFRTPVDFQPQQINLNPYLLGYFLNKHFSDTEYSKIIDYLKDFDMFEQNIFNNFLKDNNLLENLHIPFVYKSNSKNVRIELLSGIIDSIGTFDPIDNIVELTSNSEKFLDDIIFVARSLGFYAFKKSFIKNNDFTFSHHTFFKCFINGNFNILTSSKLFKNYTNLQNNDNVLISGFKIQKLEYGEYFGFTLDNNHRFLLDDFSVVHNTGKTTLIASLLYGKKHIFPVAMAMSGSEDSNHFYKQILPSTFVFNDYDPEQIKSFVKRQKMAKLYLENPWAILLLDDCTDDPKIFNSKLQHAIYKKGRHWNMWYILSLQYSMDVKPVIRTNVDGIFILRESILKNRENLWRNYAGIIPDFKLFCTLMDELTDDFTAMYIHNTGTSNDWRDCVYWYKAPIIPKDFKFGCKEYWDFHEQRFNENYVDPFDV